MFSTEHVFNSLEFILTGDISELYSIFICKEFSEGCPGKTWEMCANAVTKTKELQPSSLIVPHPRRTTEDRIKA